MRKGKSGRQLAIDNVELVKAWLKEREFHRDWNEYAYNNRINRSVLADELSFAKSVCTQNDAVRKILEAADALWFKSEAVNSAAIDAARERVDIQLSRFSSDNSQLQKRIAELEAENKQLRSELRAFKAQQALIEGGAAGFRL